MRTHLGHKTILQRSGLDSRSTINKKDTSKETEDDYSVFFREQFCVAAAEIAEELGEPLESVGVLFDHIFNTGQSTSSRKSSINLESGRHATRLEGKGLLLFLVRSADRSAVEQLSASGYRFTETQNVSQIIARRMQIHTKDFTKHLNNMQEYANQEQLMEPDVHLSCFATRARVTGGFDVLVQKDARMRLPAIKLPLDTLEDWQIEFLSQLDDFTLSACVKFLTAQAADAAAPKLERNFSSQLLQALNTLRDEIHHPIFSDALLISKPVSAPSKGPGGNQSQLHATLIAFRIMLPIQFRSANENFVFTPLRFFRLQQFEYRNDSDQALFSRVIHREFGPLLMQDNASVDTAQKSLRSPTLFGRALDGLKSARSPDGSKSFNIPSPTVRNDSDASSERKLVDGQSYGGIMVSQEVSVDIAESRYTGEVTDSNEDLNGVEMLQVGSMELGTSGQATREAEDPNTFVDVLFSRCIPTG